ncbi:MAG: site-specific DNA-methyltransferase [Caldilineaceae bacterium]
MKCACIDPPYNTGSAFTHYDDGIEHSLWLSLVRDRIEIIRNLLSPDGTLWIFIDDNESHYLKVMCDEIFGRQNFVANVIWQKKYSPANDSLWLCNRHDRVLVCARVKEIWRPNRLARSENANKAYKNPDDDPRGPWKTGDYTCNKTADERPNLYYEIVNPHTGASVWPNRTRVWAYEPDAHRRNEEQNLVWWGKDGGNSVPAYKRFLHDMPGVVPQTIWEWRDVGHTQDAKREQLQLNLDDPFPTPKPESVIARVLEIATNPGDLVLDSFAGSGTTGAVAHKMGRRWIMVELGEHCHTHIIPRLRKVIDGDDPGGITAAVEWQGGGGFRYYRLAPSLLQADPYGQWVINKQYDAAMLAAAVCKLEGFTYAPSSSHYWRHGHSTERDFIYVTTQTLARDQLQHLSDQVGAERSLLVCCGAFRVQRVEDFPNLTIKKIPTAVLARCEWGRDDYSLQVANLPLAPEGPLVAPQVVAEAEDGVTVQGSLFDGG